MDDYSNPMEMIPDEQVDWDEQTGATQGLVGGRLVPTQWCVLRPNETEYETVGEKNTPRIHFQWKCDEKYSGTPGMIVFLDLWLTKKEGAQAIVDSWCKATKIGLFPQRFGAAKEGKNDQRPTVADVKQAGEFLATQFKKCEGMIVCLDAEPCKCEDCKGKPADKKVHDDKNTLRSYHRITPERLEALVESGFMGRKCISVKKDGSFVPKPQSGSEQRGARPSSEGPRVIPG